jgi:hypothetical protein
LALQFADKARREANQLFIADFAETSFVPQARDVSGRFRKSRRRSRRKRPRSCKSKLQ